MTFSDPSGQHEKQSGASPANLTRGRARGSNGSFWDRQLRARIGQDLRTIFEKSLHEPVPEHLSSLLLQIEMIANPGTARQQSSQEAQPSFERGSASQGGNNKP